MANIWPWQECHPHRIFGLDYVLMRMSSGNLRGQALRLFANREGQVGTDPAVETVEKVILSGIVKF